MFIQVIENIAGDYMLLDLATKAGERDWSVIRRLVGVCNCSMFCCTLLYVHSSIAIILMGKRELIALLNLSFWCLVMVERLFLTVPRGCLQFVIVVFPDHTHLLFLYFSPFLKIAVRFAVLQSLGTIPV